MANYDAVDILIVEDNPNDVELMLRALKKANLANNLFVVGDGEEALEYIFCRKKYAKRKPCEPLRVIFLDLKLPKINGLDVLKEIKSNGNTKNTPVVIITSSKEDPDIQSAYELGANGYVVKPVDFDAFQQAINNTGLFWLVVNEIAK